MQNCRTDSLAMCKETERERDEATGRIEVISLRVAALEMQLEEGEAKCGLLAASLAEARSRLEARDTAAWRFSDAIKVANGEKDAVCASLAAAEKERDALLTRCDTLEHDVILQEKEVILLRSDVMGMGRLRDEVMKLEKEATVARQARSALR